MSYLQVGLGARNGGLKRPPHRPGVMDMGLFSGLEGSLEKYIEGFFRDRFRGRVQPLDIAKKLAREMRDRKRVSVNLVYAPNEYEVYLSPEDWESISCLAGALSGELQDYLSQKAGEREFTLVAPPRVIFFHDGELRPGQVRVSGKFSGPEAVDAGLGPECRLEDTMNYRPARDTAPVPVAGHIYRHVLEIIEGPGAGRVFRLEGHPLVLGRRELCDIVLPDGGVSRRHARLEPGGDGWVITDLNSTNGTFVNGERIKSKALSSGDSVKMGATLCVYKVD